MLPTFPDPTTSSTSWSEGRVKDENEEEEDEEDEDPLVLETSKFDTLSECFLLWLLMKSRILLSVSNLKL